ncbi:MAG: hypothetical protein KC619_03900 [Myxococcales bacterium]|nr:hypothetical protein [Myxococcales bacterium]
MNKLAGMALRRPVGRGPSDEDVQALEETAERIASKAPGEPVEVALPTKKSKSSARRHGEREAQKPKTRKVQITAYLPRDLRDRLNRAAVALSGPPSHESVTSIVERAIERELDRLEREHGKFPETDFSPRPGRRPGR